MVGALEHDPENVSGWMVWGMERFGVDFGQGLLKRGIPDIHVLFRVVWTCARRIQVHPVPFFRVKKVAPYYIRRKCVHSACFCAVTGFWPGSRLVRICGVAPQWSTRGSAGCVRARRQNFGAFPPPRSRRAPFNTGGHNVNSKFCILPLPNKRVPAPRPLRAFFASRSNANSKFRVPPLPKKTTSTVRPSRRK